MSVRVAVAGLGGAGWDHCEKRILKVDGLELAGVCDTDPERLARAEKEFGVKGYGEYERMLAEPSIDAVVVATPTSFHLAMALDAIQAGKHVIVEKPMCLDRQEADRLVEAARAKGVILTVYHSRRWDTDYLGVVQIVRSGALGKITNAEFRGGAYGSPQGWRGKKELGGGILYDWGSHNIDQLLRLADARIASVYGIIGTHLGNEVDDYFKTIIRFESGVVGQIERSVFYRTPMPKCLVLGELGSVATGWDKIDCLALQVAGIPGNFVPTKLPPGNSLEFYENVRDVISGKTSDLIVTPEQARDVVLVIDAIWESSRTGQVVKWRP